MLTQIFLNEKKASFTGINLHFCKHFNVWTDRREPESLICFHISCERMTVRKKNTVLVLQGK